MSTAIHVRDGIAAGRRKARPPRRSSGAAAAGDAPLDRVIFRDLPLGSIAAAAVAAVAAGSGWTAAAGPWPWIVSLAVIGLPHGAADLMIGRAMAGGSARELALGGMLYLGGMAVVGTLFALAPAEVLVLFAALSIWHFGIGHRDTEPRSAAECFAGADGASSVRRPSIASDAIAALARAGIVLGLPSAAWPGETAAVANRLVELLHAGWAVASPFVEEDVRVAGLALVAASAAAILAEVVRRRDASSRWLVIEAAVFAFAGLVADPLWSVGIYYVCWHSWRHLRALVAAVEQAGGPRSLVAAIGRIHRLALPLLVPSWLVLGGLWWLLSPGHSARDLAILSIGVYVVVTPSHDVLVRRFLSRHERDDTP